MNDLATIIPELLAGSLSTGQLKSGLKLQFKPDDADNPDNRFCAFRIGKSVTTGDLTNLRRELEKLLPGTEIVLDPEQTITGRDNRKRYYRVFRWAGRAPAAQLELLHVETAGRRQYRED